MPEAKEFSSNLKHPVDGDTPDGCTHLSQYTLDSWENDPYLDPSPERAAKVAAESFMMLRDLDTSPEDIPNPETRAKYEAFLNENE